MFAGNYCPECGQEASPSISARTVMSGFFRSAADYEQGLWPTLVGLTIRPGQTLSRYMQGAREGIVNPGRYLFLACVAYFAVHLGLDALGLRAPIAETLGVSRQPGIDLILADSLAPLLGHQEYHFAHGVIMVGLVALLLWRLFRTEIEDGATSLAIGSFLVAHALLLATVLRLLYISGVSLLTGRPATTPFLLGFTVFAGYPVFALSDCFGVTLKNVLKGALTAVWAFVDMISLLAVGCITYGIWLARTYPDTYVPAELSVEQFTMVLVITCVVLAIPLLVHLIVEGYYRLL